MKNFVHLNTLATLFKLLPNTKTVDSSSKIKKSLKLPHYIFRYAFSELGCGFFGNTVKLDFCAHEHRVVIVKLNKLGQYT